MNAETTVMTENNISYAIRGAIFKAYNTLGPGLLESVYVAALVFELKKSGLTTQTEVPLPAIYEEEKLDLGFNTADITGSIFRKVNKL